MRVKPKQILHDLALDVPLMAVQLGLRVSVRVREQLFNHIPVPLPEVLFGLLGNRCHVYQIPPVIFLLLQSQRVQGFGD